MIIFMPEMKIEEAYTIVSRAPYLFSDEEINEFEFDVNQFYDNGIKPMTLEMLYISRWGILPQKELRHAPDLVLIRNNNVVSDTCAMCWILKNKSLPPKDLLHALGIRSRTGYTCAMLYIMVCKTLPPDELLHDPSICTDLGQTCADLYLIYVDGLFL